MQDAYGYALELPYLLEGKDKLTLGVTDAQLRGSRRHFVRLDLYPLITPSRPRRHYGWWDIPLKHIVSEKTDLEFDLGSGILRIVKRGGKAIEIKRGWNSDFTEAGYISIHMSLWRTSMLGSRATMISTRTYYGVAAGTDRSLPLRYIQVPVTTRCNLSCVMCPGQSYQDFVEMDVSDEVFRAALDAAPIAAEVQTTWYGEPLLNGRIYSMVATLKERMSSDSELGLATNATLLNERNTARLFRAGVDFLMLSLDGASRETVEAIRVGVDFDTVIQSIRNCVTYRKALSSEKPRLSCHFVILDSNLHEIPQYVSLCADLGVDFVCLGYRIDSESGMFQTFGTQQIGPVFEKAIAIAARRGIALHLPPLVRSEEQRCYFMQHALISISGDVVPCCAMANVPRRMVSFGNVKQQRLIDIWNDARYVTFRRKVLAGDFPDECTGCDYKTGLRL